MEAPPRRLEVRLPAYCRVPTLRGWRAFHRLGGRRGGPAHNYCRALGRLHSPGAETQFEVVSRPGANAQGRVLEGKCAELPLPFCALDLRQGISPKRWL